MNTKSSKTSAQRRPEAWRSTLGRLRRQAAGRGVTLVEVLIVVAIIAMVAGGVAVFALPKYKEAQIKNAETGARIVRTAVQQWQAANNETTCPTISQLVQEKQLDPSGNNLAWPFSLSLSLSLFFMAMAMAMAMALALALALAARHRGSPGAVSRTQRGRWPCRGRTSSRGSPRRAPMGRLRMSQGC